MINKRFGLILIAVLAILGIFQWLLSIAASGYRNEEPRKIEFQKKFDDPQVQSDYDLVQTIIAIDTACTKACGGRSLSFSIEEGAEDCECPDGTIIPLPFQE